MNRAVITFLTLFLCGSLSFAQVNVYPQKEIGSIKPVNGVNNGPESPREDQSRDNFSDYSFARFPFARTHDAALYSRYGGEHTVDISAVFPDFNADPEDENSYDFPVTDKYIASIIKTGTAVFFRLGQSIDHRVKKYNIAPPADNHKVASICEHIIRHYNEGWADGFFYNIQYWEIWNEPDLHYKWEDLSKKPTWGGTTDEFYDLYETVAKHLKQVYPGLKIGGPASCGHEEWLEAFLIEMNRRSVPMDFVSWHYYTQTPEELARRASAVRNMMDNAGYKEAESILNEWNYIKNWTDDFQYSIDVVGSEKGAAFCAASFILCQDAPVDILMYYDARPNTQFNGLFDFRDFSPLPAYYAFYGWSRLLYDYGTQVKTTVDNLAGIYVSAATDSDGNLALFVSRYSDDDNMTAPVRFKIKINGGLYQKAVGHLTDKSHRYTEVPVVLDGSEMMVTLKQNSFIVIELD